MGSKTEDRTGLSMKLEDGAAHLMGDGIVVVVQRDPGAATRRKTQTVVLTTPDLEALRGASRLSLTIPMEDGEAYHMGAGLFVVTQRDRTRTGQPMQNIVVSANDTAAMLAAAA